MEETSAFGVCARVAKTPSLHQTFCAHACASTPHAPTPQWPPRVLRGFWRRRRPGIPAVVPGQREEARCVARAMACMPSRLLCERIRTPRACPSRHVQNENRGTEGKALNFGAIPSAVGATYSGTPPPGVGETASCARVPWLAAIRAARCLFLTQPCQDLHYVTPLGRRRTDSLSQRHTRLQTKVPARAPLSHTQCFSLIRVSPFPRPPPRGHTHADMTYRCVQNTHRAAEFSLKRMHGAAVCASRSARQQSHSSLLCVLFTHPGRNRIRPGLPVRRVLACCVGESRQSGTRE